MNSEYAVKTPPGHLGPSKKIVQVFENIPVSIGFGSRDLSGKHAMMKQLINGSGIDNQNHNQKLLPKRLAICQA